MPWLVPVLGIGAGLIGGIMGQNRNNQLQGRSDALLGQQQGAIDSMLGYAPKMEATLGQYGGLMDQLQQLYGQAQAPQQGVDALYRNAQGVLDDTSGAAYQRQAQLAGDNALGQLGASMAARGLGSSGASARLGASTLAGLYADASARRQQDRLNAYGISNSALGTAQGLQDNRMGLLQSLLQTRGGLVGSQLQGLQAISGLYGNAAGLYGNAAGGLQNQMDPNPWGGVTAGLGGLGNFLAQKRPV